MNLAVMEVSEAQQGITNEPFPPVVMVCVVFQHVFGLVAVVERFLSVRLDLKILIVVNSEQEVVSIFFC